MDQLTLHVRSVRSYRSQPEELKDISTFLKRVQDSSKTGKLIVERFISWFNSSYHAILVTNDAKLYLFQKDENSIENKCEETIDLRGAMVRHSQTNQFVITTASDDKKYFIAENERERNIWCSKIAESIQNQFLTIDERNEAMAAFVYEEEFVNVQEIIIVDDNKEQGIIDDDIYQVPCYVEVSGSKGNNISFSVRMSYERTIKCIVEHVLNVLAHKYCPIIFGLISINKKSCTNTTIYALKEMDNMNIKMSTFSHEDIQNKGLYLVVNSMYCHRVETPISCPFMLDAARKHQRNEDEEKEEKLDAMICPIYREMIVNKTFNNEHLSHIEDETHFKNEYQDKPQCPEGQNCQAFKETEHGMIRIEFKCHISLYRHPPGNNKLKAKSNMKEFVTNSKKKQNHPLYVPSEQEFKRHDDNTGFYHELLKEVKNNGFVNDLMPQNDGTHLIERVVVNKLKSKRHILMGSPLTKGQMLALVLMSSGDCCVNIGYQHRKREYKKWKWFDYCLYWAIYSLSQRECGHFKVYSGLNNVFLPHQTVKNQYFMTYKSTSWQEHVATKFMGQKGMILEIDANFKNDKDVYCCDVSWISKFPDECEILFSRSIGGWSSNSFSCDILDHKHGIQRVFLKKQMTLNQDKIKKIREVVQVQKPMKEWDTAACINWINSLNKGAKFPQKLKNKFIFAVEKADACDGEFFYDCEDADELCQLLNMTKNKAVCKRLYQYIQGRKQEDNMKLIKKYEFDSWDQEKRNVVCLDSNYEDITLVLGNEQHALFERIKETVNRGGDIVIVANGLNEIIDVEIKEEVEKAYI